MSANDILISMQGISKVFLTDEVETYALSGINLEIRKGEYVSVAGPSGSGKSTLLAIIGLLDSPSGGRYLLKNQSLENLDISDRAIIRNREIGFIFQSFNLIGELTVYENVELPLTYRSMSGAERKRRVQQSLERVGMSHRTAHYPSQLSGGQQQRVAIARALAQEAIVLLADEPVSSLDPEAAAAVLEALRVVARAGVAVVASLHQVHLAAAYADRIIALRAGRVIEDAPVNRLDAGAFDQIYARAASAS